MLPARERMSFSHSCSVLAMLYSSAGKPFLTAIERRKVSTPTRASMLGAPASGGEASFGVDGASVVSSPFSGLPFARLLLGLLFLWLLRPQLGSLAVSGLGEAELLRE